MPKSPWGTFVWAYATHPYFSSNCTTSDVSWEGDIFLLNPQVSIKPSTFKWSLTVKGTPLGFLFNALSILTSANELSYLNFGLRVLQANVLKTSSLLILTSSEMLLSRSVLSILFLSVYKSLSWSDCLLIRNCLFFISSSSSFFKILFKSCRIIELCF